MGVLAIAMIGGGIGLIWSGIQGVNFLDVLKSVLSGDPVPRAAPAVAAGAVSPGTAPAVPQTPTDAPSGTEPSI